MVKEINEEKGKKFSDLQLVLTPIETEEDYFAACDILEKIDDCDFDSEKEQSKRYIFADALSTLVEAYETKHFKFDRPKMTVAQIINQIIEQMNTDKKSLEFLKDPTFVSEIMNGKRELTLEQIRILHKELKISAELLIGV